MNTSHQNNDFIELMLLLIIYLCAVLFTNQPQVSAIAHAGGGIEGSTYTNSFEAMNFNYSEGFELFELDFSWTSDNHLVCLHDWKTTPAWLLNYYEKKPVSLKRFHSLDQKRSDVTLCDLDSLNLWLIAHPKAFIVSDIKAFNAEGLKLMVRSIENATERIIPQITQPEEYPQVKEMGFESIIWTLYKYIGSDQQVIESATNMNLFAIAMPTNRAKRGLAYKIKALEIPTYVHTINNSSEALEYQNNFGLTSIYTDFLPPEVNSSTKNEVNNN